MNTILCPHCGQEVELSEAFTHNVRETVRKEQEKTHKLELEKVKLEAQEEAVKRANEKLDFEVKQAKEEAADSAKRNKELQDQILELTKSIRELKNKDQERELEMQKTLMREREKIEESIAKTEQEKSRLEKMALQKKLDDTQKLLEDAQKKAQQSSQQLQGEILELDIEQQLQEQFPTDEVSPVPKGFEGADLLQAVKNKFGQTAGVVIWELKRTKSFDSKWTARLRENKRKIDASVAVLVTETLPKGVENFGYYENVWVCSFAYAIPLANVLRISLFELAVAKATTANKDERLEALFNYLVKDGFRNKFEAQVEGIIALRGDLEAEQRSTVRMWKKRETELKRLMNNVAVMYGELQGILGSSLPALPSLEGPALGDGKETEDKLLEA